MGVIFNMKSTGIVRKMDDLGRIVLPAELRRQFELAEKDAVEIFTENDKIILKKYAPSCIFCENTKNTFTFNNKVICKKCISKLSKL